MIAESSSSRKRAIVWFRKDLRLADHPALDAALQGGMEIIPVFIWDKEEGGPGPPVRRLVVASSCSRRPRKINQSKGSKLIFASGRAAEELPKLLRLIRQILFCMAAVTIR